jgi:WD40 repeat protein
MSSSFPDRLVIVVGTYDGVIAGWDTSLDVKRALEEKGENQISTVKESPLTLLHQHRQEQNDDSYLKLKFAMPVHEGSVRTVSIASGIPSSANQENKEQLQTQESSTKKRRRDTTSAQEQGPESHETSTSSGNTCTTIHIPEILLSAGYDETMAVFSLSKGVQSGELKTPADLGTPTCSCFAPPSTSYPTHVLIGMSSGKIIIYKRRDWSVQHILSGHDDRGITCLAVHPTGKMALSGGKDGKIILWDLLKGKLAFVYKIPNPSKGVMSCGVMMEIDMPIVRMMEKLQLVRLLRD